MYIIVGLYNVMLCMLCGERCDIERNMPTLPQRMHFIKTSKRLWQLYTAFVAAVTIVVVGVVIMNTLQTETLAASYPTINNNKNN